MAPVSVRDTPKVGVHRSKSQVFVEIPCSPLLGISRFAPPPRKVEKHFNQHEGHKENSVPLFTKISVNDIPANAVASGKRQLQDDEDTATHRNPRKPKILKLDGDNRIICHQCRSRKSPDVVLQCTSNLKSTGKRCMASYCDTCLKIRYGEKLDAIRQRKLPQSREGHDPDTSYHFACPRCSNTCNCAKCRKKKGLAPVGRLMSTERWESVREILENNPLALGFLPKKVVLPAAKPSRQTEGENRMDASNNSKGIVHRQKAKIKAVPEPVWRPLQHSVTRQEIEDRIYLREFILRFNPILDISLRNVEELDDFTTLHDQSTKAALIALLDLIAVEDDDHKKNIQATIRTIRGLGLNWTKIVPVLDKLRDSVPESHALCDLPNLKHPETQAVYNTRGMRMQGIHADQLLPVLLYLCELVSVGNSVRQELDEGMRQGKEVRAAHIKAQREETERWTAQRAKFVLEKEGVNEKGPTMDAFKLRYRDAEFKHKAISSDIRNSYKPELDVCRPRFMPLGLDIEGRIYYALSASGPQRGKKERLLGEGERSKKWGWFISVWGKPGTVIAKEDKDTVDPDEDTDQDAERWWFFADVHEMRKLSKWLTYRADTELSVEEADPATITSIGKSMHTAAITISRTRNLRHSSARNAVALELRSHSLPSLSDFDLEDDHVDREEHKGLDPSQPVTQLGLRALAKSVLEFADFIEWRMTTNAE